MRLNSQDQQEQRHQQQQQQNLELDPEKLSQEAFRLMRTAQNLLNTQEPVLLQTKKPSMMVMNNGGDEHISARDLFLNVKIENQPFSVGYNRKMNIRNSRLSLRSSTDDSVHSNSSTKSETDEELRDRPSPPLPLSIMPMKDHHQPIGGSSADDESGFSSMNSFQEIGLPLINSTMLSTIGSLQESTSSESNDGRDLTLCPSQSQLNSLNSNTNSQNKIGLPVTKHTHRRWDSAPIVVNNSSRKTLSTLSTVSSGSGGAGDGDDTFKVLWV